MIFVALCYAFLESFLGHFSCTLQIEKFDDIKRKQKKREYQQSWLKDNKIHATDKIIVEKFNLALPTMKRTG